MSGGLFTLLDLPELMLEHPLAGEDHGHFGIGLVAGRDGFEVPVGAAGLHDR